jgi:hypothetical protein
MLTIKSHLPRNSTRFLAAARMIREKEQKRHSSLTIQTLNPLVKEVEYAVRGRHFFFPLFSIIFLILIKGPIVIRAGEIEKQLKVNTISFKSTYIHP